MFKTLFSSLAKSTTAQRAISRWKVSRKASRRYVAGETLEEAVQAVRQLNRQGLFATLDLLGENTTNHAEAEKAAINIMDMLDVIHETRIRTNISIKLTQIGLTLDPDVCQQNLAKILTKAHSYQNFVRIDMEDSSFTEKIIDQYLLARENGFSNVGIVIQAYLYRSRNDIENLESVHARIRLCKGAYNEPATSAFPAKKKVDENYDNLSALLLHYAREAGSINDDPDGFVPPIPAFATHDINRIEKVISLARLLEIPQSAFEFQMLYGIRRDLQQRLREEGYNVRVYVPFGTQWYPYFMRRLAERPANVWFFASNLFRK